MFLCACDPAMCVNMCIYVGICVSECSFACVRVIMRWVLKPLITNAYYYIT